MKAFRYLTADSFAAGARALRDLDGAVAKGAGTDLLDLLKKRVVAPDEVLNLLRAEKDAGDGALPALATLADIAGNAWVRDYFPAVHKAAAEAATPQIRNVGTLGGNLCQHTRCWYFRNPSFTCHKRGDGACSAAEEGAHNRYHAIFPHDRCMSAHPSNLAPALIAVGARVECVHPDGDRTLDLELIYDEGPAGRLSDHNLRPGELIRSVKLTPTAMTKRSTYVEFRERLSFDFAVASVAAALDLRDGVVHDARIVCGAVSPVPWRARAAEESIKGKPLDPSAAAEAAAKDAAPTEQNRYKVAILKSLVRRALEELGK